MQCCCGKYKNLSEPLICNDYQHEPLGPSGNFCGPHLHHRLRDLENTVARLRDQLQNCVNHLDRAKRQNARNEMYETCIESANKALYETLIHD